MQTPLQIKLATDSLADGQLQVSRLSGRETISQLFEYELLVVCRADEDFDAEALMGERATLIYERDEQEVSRLHGMISVVHDRFESESEHRSYQLTFVPRAYRLSLVETLDIFLDTSVPDIIRQKLGAIGLEEKPKPGVPQKPDGYDFEFRLRDAYPAREFVVQYQETDLAFISRLCEHLGVSFFFEHQGGREVMVFTDANEGFWPLPAGDVPFRARGEHRDVYRFEETIRMIPADYVVRDYNYRTPQLSLTGSARTAEGTGSVVEYGAHVKTPEEATKMAGIRAEERLAGRRVFDGTADLATLRAGTRFRLTGNARGDVGLLVTEVRPSASQSTLGGGAGGPGFQVEFKAIQQTRRFRPPRLTPKPKIHGVVTGVIDASDQGSKYADVDDQGRYRVKFLFDTTGPDSMQGSRLVRMAQPHSGAGYGMHFPLRPGVEVIITFVDGDPDRPIIAATVPNPQTASPVHSGNAPRNILRTGGGNEMNIDDTDGEHRIKLSTPHKNTTLQLGYRNSPENGAMIETMGAQSTMASSATAMATSVKSAITVFSEWTNAGNIYSVAEFDAKWAALLGVVGSATEFVNLGIEIAKANLEFALAEKEKALADLKVQSIKDQVQAQKDAEEAAKKRAAAVAAAEAAAKPYNDAADAAVVNGTSTYGVAEKALRAKFPPPSAAYDAAEADLLKQPGMADSKAAALAAYKEEQRELLVKPYEDAVDAEIDSSTSAYAVAEKALRASIPVGSPGYEHAEEELLKQPGMADAKKSFYEDFDSNHGTLAANKEKFERDEKLAEYKEKQEAYEKAQLTLHTDQEFLRDAKKGEATGTYTAETESYQKAVDADQKALDAAKADLAAASTGLDASLTDDQKKAIQDSKDADAAADESWNKALESKRSYDEAYEDLELGDTAYNLKWAKSQLDIYGQIPILFSVLLTVIGLIKEIIEHIKQLREKLEDTAKILTVPRREKYQPLENVPPAPATQLFLGPFLASNKKRVKHVIGSAGLTKVYGEANLYMEGGHAMLKGDEATTVLAKEKLGLYAGEVAELAATKEVKVTAPAVDIESQGEFKLRSVIGLMSGQKGSIEIEARDEMELTSKMKDIKIEATAKSVFVSAKKKIEVTAGDANPQEWGMTVDGTAGKVSVGHLKDDAWRLDVKAKQASLGAKDEYLAIEPKRALLRAKDGTYLNLKEGHGSLVTSSDLKISSPKITLGATVDVSGSLLVKGDPVQVGPPQARLQWHIANRRRQMGYDD